MVPKCSTAEVDIILCGVLDNMPPEEDDKYFGGSEDEFGGDKGMIFVPASSLFDVIKC